ncbi:MAG: uroporphyrinogen-III C-methyltransferase [Haemophilus parainfluenzae]|nr:uroporphyrinogen-III C-methyltransferase [Haemophilus parainfluenzae]MDU4440698.1 uroporphyrinogen-III C-methyltransferase [Haemophilus parainfluenzae]MDU4498163.1 uroporphyrinogen-III C-methyltransferase [Haemophilus parainfluenzae]
MAKEKLTPETTDEIQATDAVEIQTEDREPVAPRTQTVVKKSGTGLSLLAILIALGVGGAGYYFGQQQVDEFQQKLTALEAQINNKTVVSAPAQDVKFDTTQLTQLESENKATQDKIAQVEELINAKSHELVGLQSQINKVSAQANAQQPTDWLFSEADFLLNNALRKLVLDNDVDTAVSLLKLADETLAKVNNSQSAAIRSAINQDLKQLLSVAGVDQNAVMQKLSQLANTVDELPVLDVNFGDDQNATKLSDSLSDWAENAEKSATSFLNHFIRISPKHGADRKELLAPNQDIYLRENIRLRLQLAIMAVPRQQNELYKQSLEAVASWIRSYFDTNAEVTQSFLKSVDELSEVSIYVDVPSQLQSLSMLDKYLNRTPLDVQKVEIEAEKAVDNSPRKEEVKPAPEAKAEEPKAEEPKAEEKPTEAPAAQPATEPQQ